MNAPTALGSAVLTELYQPRVNSHCQEIVNQGIAVQSSFNTVCAIEYLKSHNIDVEVIKRVLLHPQLRRATH
ncbi:MAG: hypothetical protein V4754_09750 [Pseudomonadota bacterium]